ncbi:MAG: hypothetical protein E7454_00840 [Ruminococcaceae bacterium]|nr:hypothetical protein [Oscillospiraceae bacterium]
MKKISALILVLCIILSMFAFTACTGEVPGAPSGSENGGANSGGSNGPAATDAASIYKVYKDAQAKTLAATSFEAKTYQLRADIHDTGKNQEIIEKSVVISDRDSEKPTGRIDVTYPQTDDTSYNYYDGEWQYMHSGGPRNKARVEFDRFYKNAEELEDVALELPEALFTGAEVKQTADGSQMDIRIKLNEATAGTLFNEYILDKMELDVVALGEEFNLDEISIFMTIDNGYLRVFEISIVCDHSTDFFSIAYRLQREVKYISCGKPVEVVPLENLDSFREQEWNW